MLSGLYQGSDLLHQLPSQNPSQLLIEPSPERRKSLPEMRYQLRVIRIRAERKPHGMSFIRYRIETVKPLFDNRSRPHRSFLVKLVSEIDEPCVPPVEYGFG